MVTDTKEILRLMKQSALNSASNLDVIFDLDSTIFDISPRIAHILNVFGLEEENQKVHPEECQILSGLTPDPKDFGVRRTLERVGFPIKDMAFIMKIVEFWKKEFFSGNHLSWDVPYAGAVEFVKAVAGMGFRVSYLSGRDRPRMLEGTIQSLNKYDLPVVGQGENIFLKPNTDITDVAFKKSFFLNLPQLFANSSVYFFENEPCNIEVARLCKQKLEIIYVNTVHGFKCPEPGEDIYQILSWI